MFRLLKKFSWVFLAYSALLIGVIFPLFNHDRITGPQPFSLTFAYYLAVYLYMVVLGSLWMHEQMESKSRGYHFLRLLPVRPGSIVGSKFLLVFLTVLVYVGFHCAAFHRISADPAYWEPSCTIIILNGGLCLLLAGALYLGLFRYGFQRFSKFLIISWMGAVIAPIPLNLFLLPRFGLSHRDIIDLLTGMNWMLVTPAVLAAFLGLMIAATHVLKKRFEMN